MGGWAIMCLSSAPALPCCTRLFHMGRDAFRRANLQIDAGRSMMGWFGFVVRPYAMLR